MTVEELEIIIRTNNKDSKQKIAEISKQLDALKTSSDKGDKSITKFSSAMNTARQGADKGSKSVSSLSGAIRTLKAGAAVAALKVLASAVKKVTDAYAVKQSAQLGLESILESQNKNVDKAKQFLTEYTKDGLVPLTNAYMAYKQLASAGYDDKQTQSILQNLKDSASFGRQNSLTMGEAVQSATEGIKNQNSILVDNAGVTKNLSVMWEEYAKSIGKTVGNLTAEEQRIATVNGIMRETAYQTGNAAKYANTYAGAQAMLKTQTTLLSAAMGSILAPALQSIMPHLTSIVERLTAMAERIGQIMGILFNVDSNKTATASLAAGAQKASTGLTTAVTKAKELKRTLLGIDEINILSKDTTSTSSSGSTAPTSTTATTGAGSAGVPNISPELTSGIEKIKAFKAALESWKPALEKIIAIYKTFYKVVVEPIIKYVSPKLSEAWKNIKEKFKELADQIKGSKYLDDIKRIIEVIGPVLVAIYKKFADIGVWFDGFVLNQAFIDLKWLIKDIEDYVGGFADLLNGDFSGAWEHFKNLMVDNKIDHAKESLGNLKDKLVELKSIVSAWVGEWKKSIMDAVNAWKTKITDWWNNNVHPWFTKEKWDALLFEIGASVGRAIVKFRDFFKVALPKWWAEDVKPWFTLEKWDGIYNNIKTALSNKLTELKTTAAAGLSDFWNNGIKPWFTLEKWKELGSNIKKGIIGGIKAAVAGIVDFINGLISAIESGVNLVLSGVRKILEGYNSIPALGDIDLAPYKDKKFGRLTIQNFSTGGFPDSGTLFRANEDRSKPPEMVGNLGGRTAVANNGQIVEGIKQGVMEAMQASNNNSGGTWTFIIQRADSTEESRFSISGAQRMNQRSGKTVIPVGA